ncbi:MAG: histidine phosphatase family protein [Caldilineaceae bacterium]|nr:histidine phosphatase family protein [Caldilineaceae bacterium]
MTATLYLIRHATPDWHRKDIRYDIPPGPPLVEQGEAEARQLGEFLKTTGITHLYASPLERASRTAQIAAEALGLEVETMLDIAEWVQGEPEASVLARCRPCLDAALDESETRGPIALVSHGGPIRLLLADLGVDHAELEHYRGIFDNLNPVPPAGVWRVERYADGRMGVPELVFTPQPYTRYVPTTVNV